MAQPRYRRGSAARHTPSAAQGERCEAPIRAQVVEARVPRRVRQPSGSVPPRPAQRVESAVRVAERCENERNLVIESPSLAEAAKLSDRLERRVATTGTGERVPDHADH